MNALAQHTARIFDSVSRMECIRDFVLVGGTALSLQIGNRQSEDLDFMRWRTGKNETMEVEWAQIKKELERIAPIEHMDLLDIDHVEFILDGVKLSFYASPKYSPVTQPVHIQHNLYAADLTAIGAMKMEVLLRRSTFRDYYDIYSLLQHGVSFDAMMQLALSYSGHMLHTKSLLMMLTNGDRFRKDSRFAQLQPAYDVSPADIEQYIKSILNIQDENIN